MIRAGIVGAAGYTGGEVIRLLLNHASVELSFVQSTSQKGKRVDQIHGDLAGETEMCFSATRLKEVDVLFFCTRHGESAKIIAEETFPPQIKLIDLSQDFRLHNPPGMSFVYGLPELNRDKIKNANAVANPGCFATAIELGLLPLAHSGLLREEVHVCAVTGSTGAGQHLQETSHFSWREANFAVYKPFKHQHLDEINLILREMQPEWTEDLTFLPLRGNFTRGILAAVYTKTVLTKQEAQSCYAAYYQQHPFVTPVHQNPAMKQVLNTNKCLLYLEKQDERLLIISVIDNLLKGAAGQAVQNMNLMFGFPETTGLKLKPSAY